MPLQILKMGLNWQRCAWRHSYYELIYLLRTSEKGFFKAL